MRALKTGNTFGRYSTVRMVKAGVGLLGIAGLGYVVAVAVEHGGSLLNLASPFALESQMVPPEVLTGARDAGTSGGTATAAVPTAPTQTEAERGSDYFPDHYRNQAKELAEPVDTF